MSRHNLRSAPPTRTQTESDVSSDDDEELELLQRLANMFQLNSQSAPLLIEPQECKEKNPQEHFGTGFIYHPVMTKHKCDWDDSYPENPKRITVPYQRCQDLGLISRCKSIKMRYATEDEVLQGHVTEHLERAKSTATMTLEELKEISSKCDSWFANQFTYEAALASAGSTITLMDDVLHDKVTNGFAMVRPPGHHAMENEFNGYCTFNNVVLAAKSALEKGMERIMIVDWDVHHGQGVQRMFYDDPRVLYLSIHRYEYGHFWPNLRESDYDYIGERKGQGFNVNVPLNKTGMTDADYMAILNQLILPLAYEYSPQLVLVSSGYDAAIGCPEFSPDLVVVSHGLDSSIGDEKGEMLLTPPMYAHMTYHLMALANGRVCVVLEGGYCIKSLAEGCALTLRSLLLDPCPQMAPTAEPSDCIAISIVNLIKMLRPYWNCFKHFKFLGDSESCPLEGVNSMPPVEGVKFLTPPMYPEHLEGQYPQQTPEEIKKNSDAIDQIISDTKLTMAKNRCCYVFDADMRAHRNLHSKGHPERPDRISSIFNKLVSWSLLDRCLAIPSRLARKSEVTWIHETDYIEDLCQTQSMSDDDLERIPGAKCYNSVYLHQKSLHCALLSCGSLLNVTEAVLTGQAQSGVAIIRPPGHHAESHKAMGFCFINNVAVAVRFAQKNFNIGRVLILDWDVHHGNATQHQFYDDPSVLYISLHRYDNGFFFPGSHDADEYHVGGPEAQGFNVNIPWSYGRMGDSEYLTAFTQIVMPLAYQFAPELVFVSAGFDAAVGDPLGGYHVSPPAYGHMTHMLAGLANGKVILALEGGYNLHSISQSMATCTSVLLGDPCPVIGPLKPCQSAMNTIHKVLEAQKPYWSCLKCNVGIPAYPCGDQPSEDAGGENSEKTDVAGFGSQSCRSDGASTNQQPTASEDNTDSSTRTEGVESESQEESLSTALSGVKLEDAKDRSQGERSSPQPQEQAAKDIAKEEEEAEENLSRGQRWPPEVQDQFVSSLYQGEPDLEPLSIFMDKVPQATPEGNAVAGPADQELKEGEGDTSPDQAVGGASASGGAQEEGGACGGSSRPNTLDEFLRMEGANQMFAVQPLPWCPHLSEVKPMPDGRLETNVPCSTCQDTSENWICLSCYKVECSRYVNEHMLYHRLDTEHNVTLSFSDLSVWCYACDNYVDNEIVKPMKSAAHLSKFGEALL